MPLNVRREITKLSFSTAMHSLMPDDGRRQIFLWSDLQAAETIDRFKQTKLATHFYEISGTPIHAMSPFAKVLYFQEENLYPAETHWYGIKELVMDYFTGKPVIDYATASATGMFDLRKQEWNGEILDYLGLKKEQLATLADTSQKFTMLKEIRELFDFSENIQVIVGASDGTLAAYASYYSTCLLYTSDAADE